MRAVRVLVVDDDADSRDILGLVLHGEGHDVTLAASGREVLAFCHDEGRTFDAVVLDLQMPGVDGLEVARRLRGNPSTARLPIACVSARVDGSTRDAALRAGCDCFVSKPAPPEAILEAVKSLLSK